MKLETVDINKLKPSPLNPPQREKNVNKLARSIKDIGLKQPLLVASNGVVIDGHRRLMACKQLKMDEVQIIRHNSTSSKDYDKIFVHTNEHTQLMNGNQYLWRYMQGAEIPNFHEVRIKWLEKALGRDYARGMFERILSEGKSANTYQMVMGIYCKYTNKKITNKAHMKKLAYYLLNTENCFRVKTAMAHFIPIKVLVNSVINNKKLKAQFIDKD